VSDTPILTPGYRLNSATVLRDLYRLAAALLSLKPFQEFASVADGSLLVLRERFAEDELIHLLVSTAIANRLQLDHMLKLRIDPSELSYQPLEGICGHLYEPADSKEGVPLQFRDACNKIIHARNIQVSDIMRPVLRLRGERSKTNWYVEICLLDYVGVSVRNFNDALA
jgi:hypothetical protein